MCLSHWSIPLLTGFLITIYRAPGEAEKVLATVHDGSVFCIVPRQDGKGFFTAGKDRIVKKWDEAFKRCSEVTVRNVYLVINQHSPPLLKGNWLLNLLGDEGLLHGGERQGRQEVGRSFQTLH